MLQLSMIFINFFPALKQFYSRTELTKVGYRMKMIITHPAANSEDLNQSAAGKEGIFPRLYSS